MKRHLTLALWLTFALAPGGCGVHVGNGMKRFESSEGYSVVYSEKLTLNETYGGRTVTFDNRDLLGSSTNEAARSSVTITVERAGTTSAVSALASASGTHPAPATEISAEALSRYVGAQDPHRTFERESARGAFVMVSRTNGDTSRSARYYFMLKKDGKILKGDMSAFPGGEGFDLIAPLLDTFEGL